MSRSSADRLGMSAFAWGIGALLLLAASLIFWGSGWCLSGPAGDSLSDLDFKARDLELPIYEALLNIPSAAQHQDLRIIAVKEGQAARMEEEAARIYKDIPEGTVISRNGMLVGDFKRSEELRKQAKALVDSLPDLKRAAGRAHAHELAGTPHESLYRQYIEYPGLKQQLRAEHSWYHQSWIRWPLKAVGVVGLLIGFLTAVLGLSFIKEGIVDFRRR